MDSTKIEMLSECGIDYEAGIDRFGENEAMLLKFMRRFGDDTHFEELQNAVMAGDAQAAFKAAHTLKGVVGNLSFAGYYDAIIPLEATLRAGEIDKAISLMPPVKDAHQKVIRALDEL